MGRDSPTEARSRQARHVAEALDAVEMRLDELEPGVNPDGLAEALAEPVHALTAAVREDSA